MSALVETHRDGDVAVIIVDNPPVNALKHEVRLGIQDAFLQANADKTVAAIVLTCAGRTFIAGADIAEFNKPPQSPSLIELIAVIDSTDKPVVAAMFGTALGGGLEVTLACHFRIAAAGTRLGFPEIKLGLIPGAGGTQRLPRLVGLPKAIAMVLSGNPIAAKDGAGGRPYRRDFRRRPARSGYCLRAPRGGGEAAVRARARQGGQACGHARGRRGKFDELAAPYVKRARGLHAPAAALEALRWTLDVPIAEGLAREREKFIALRDGEQSKAQRHLFFAEREAAKVPDVTKDTKLRDDQAGGGDRRRHHGRRHCDELRQCRHSRHHRRDWPATPCSAASA